MSKMDEDPNPVKKEGGDRPVKRKRSATEEQKLLAFESTKKLKIEKINQMIDMIRNFMFNVIKDDYDANKNSYNTINKIYLEIKIIAVGGNIEQISDLCYTIFIDFFDIYSKMIKFEHIMMSESISDVLRLSHILNNLLQKYNSFKTENKNIDIKFKQLSEIKAIADTKQDDFILNKYEKIIQWVHAQLLFYNNQDKIIYQNTPLDEGFLLLVDDILTGNVLNSKLAPSFQAYYKYTAERNFVNEYKLEISNPIIKLKDNILGLKKLNKDFDIYMVNLITIINTKTRVETRDFQLKLKRSIDFYEELLRSIYALFSTHKDLSNATLENYITAVDKFDKIYIKMIENENLQQFKILINIYRNINQENKGYYKTFDIVRDYTSKNEFPIRDYELKNIVFLIKGSIFIEKYELIQDYLNSYEIISRLSKNIVKPQYLQILKNSQKQLYNYFSLIFVYDNKDKKLPLDISVISTRYEQLENTLSDFTNIIPYLENNIRLFLNNILDNEIGQFNNLIVFSFADKFTINIDIISNEISPWCKLTNSFIDLLKKNLHDKYDKYLKSYEETNVNIVNLNNIFDSLTREKSRLEGEGTKDLDDLLLERKLLNTEFFISLLIDYKQMKDILNENKKKHNVFLIEYFDLVLYQNKEIYMGIKKCYGDVANILKSFDSGKFRDSFIIYNKNVEFWVKFNNLNEKIQTENKIHTGMIDDIFELDKEIKSTKSLVAISQMNIIENNEKNRMKDRIVNILVNEKSLKSKSKLIHEALISLNNSIERLKDWVILNEQIIKKNTLKKLEKILILIYSNKTAKDSLKSTKSYIKSLNSVNQKLTEQILDTDSYLNNAIDDGKIQERLINIENIIKTVISLDDVSNEIKNLFEIKEEPLEVFIFTFNNNDLFFKIVDSINKRDEIMTRFTLLIEMTKKYNDNKIEIPQNIINAINDFNNDIVILNQNFVKLGYFIDFIKKYTLVYYTLKYKNNIVTSVHEKNIVFGKIDSLINDYTEYYKILESIDDYETILNGDIKILNEKILEDILNIYSPYLKFKKLLDEQIKIKNEKKEEFKTQIDILLKEFDNEGKKGKKLIKISYDLTSYKQLIKNIDDFIKNDIPEYKKKINQKYDASYNDYHLWTKLLTKKNELKIDDVKNRDNEFLLLKNEHLSKIDSDNQSVILLKEYKTIKEEIINLKNENETLSLKTIDILSNENQLISIFSQNYFDKKETDIKKQIESIKILEDNQTLFKKSNNEKKKYIENQLVLNEKIKQSNSNVMNFESKIQEFIRFMFGNIDKILLYNVNELQTFQKEINTYLSDLDNYIISINNKQIKLKKFDYNKCVIEIKKLSDLKIKIDNLLNIVNKLRIENTFETLSPIIIELLNGIKESKITKEKIDKLFNYGNKRLKYFENYETWIRFNEFPFLIQSDLETIRIKINKGQKIVDESNNIEGLAIRTQKKGYFNTSLMTYKKLKDFIEKNRKKYENFDEQLKTHINNIKSNTINHDTICLYDLKELNQYTKKTKDLMDEIRKFQNEISVFLPYLDNIDTFISSFQTALKYEIDNLLKIDDQYYQYFFSFINSLKLWNLDDMNYEIQSKRKELEKDSERIFQRRANYLTIDILKKLNAKDTINDDKIQILMNIVENLLTKFNEYQKRKVDIEKDITKFKLQELRNKKKENVINITNNKPPSSELLLLLSLIENRSLEQDKREIEYYHVSMTNMLTKMEDYSKMNDIPSGKFNFFDNTKKNYTEFIKFIEKELLRAKKSLLNNKKYRIIKEKAENSGKLTESMINDFSIYEDNMIKIQMFKDGKSLEDKRLFLEELIDNSAILFFTYIKKEYDELKELSKDDEIKKEQVNDLINQLNFLKENETIESYIENSQSRKQLILDILKYSQIILKNPSAKEIKKEYLESKIIKEEKDEWDILYNLLTDHINQFEEEYNNFDTLYKSLTIQKNTLSNYSDIKKIPQNNEKIYFFTKNTLIDMEKIYDDSFKRIEKWMKLNRKLNHIFHDTLVKDQPKRPSINILEDIHLYISEIKYFFPKGIEDKFSGKLDKQIVNFQNLFDKETISYLTIIQKEREDINELIQEIPDQQEFNDIKSQINDMQNNISKLFSSVIMEQEPKKDYKQENPKEEIHKIFLYYKDQKNIKKFIELIVENYNFYSQNLTKIIKQKILEIKKKTKNETTWNTIKIRLDEIIKPNNDLNTLLQHSEIDYEKIEEIVKSFRIYDMIINYLPKNKYQLFDISKNRYSNLIKDIEKDIIRYEKMISNIKEIIDVTDQSDLMDNPPNQLLNKIENLKKDQAYFDDYPKNIKENFIGFVETIFLVDVQSFFKFLNREEEEIFQLYSDIPEDSDDNQKYKQLKKELLLYRKDIMFFTGDQMDVEDINKEEKHINEYDDYLDKKNETRDIDKDPYYQEIINDMINHVTKLVEKSLSEFKKKLNEFKKKDKEEIKEKEEIRKRKEKETQKDIYDDHLNKNLKEGTEILEYFREIFKKINFIKNINLKTIKDNSLKKKIELIINFKETVNYKSPKNKIPINDVLQSIEQLHFYLKPVGSSDTYKSNVSLISKSDKSLVDMKNIKYYFDQDLLKLFNIIKEIYSKFYREPKTTINKLIIYDKNDLVNIPKVIENLKEDTTYLFILPFKENVYFFPIFYIFLIDQKTSRVKNDIILDIKYEFSLKNDNFLRKIHFRELPDSIKIRNKIPYTTDLSEFDKYDYQDKIKGTLVFIKNFIQKKTNDFKNVLKEVVDIYKNLKSIHFFSNAKWFENILPEARITDKTDKYLLSSEIGDIDDITTKNNIKFSNYLKNKGPIEKYIVQFKNFNNILKNNIRINHNESRKNFIDLLIIYLSIQGIENHDLTLVGIYSLELIQYLLNISKDYKVNIEDESIFIFPDLKGDFKNFLFLPNAFEYYYKDDKNDLILQYITVFPETKYLYENFFIEKERKYLVANGIYSIGYLKKNYSLKKIELIYGTKEDGNALIIDQNIYTKQFIVDKSDTLWIKIDDIYQPMSFFDFGTKEKIIENDILFVCFVKQ